MNSKKTRFYRIFPALFLGGILVFSGCEKSNDLYNPDHLQEEAKKAFPVKDIDPNQTWETSAICNASVTVNEKSGGTYTIKVYTENPYNTNGNAYLLAKTSVADGQTANFKFDIPTTLQYVYVMKVNEEGYSSAKTVLVADKKIDASFGGTNTVAMAAKTRAVSSIVNFTAPDINDISLFPTKESTSAYPKYPTNNIWTNVKGNYIVTSDYSAIDYQGNGGGVYIKGDVTLNSLYLGGNCKLFILPQSSLTLTSSGYSLGQGGSMISIGTGATLIVGKGVLQASNATIYNLGTIKANAIEAAGSGYIYNNGTLTVTNKVNVANWKSLLVNEGIMTAAAFETQGSSTFYNSGESTISGKTFLSSNDQKWENQGYFKTNSMEIQATSSQLLNACKLYVEGEFKIDTSNDTNNSFNLDGGAYVECGSLFMDNATVKMGGNSSFNILGTATYNYNLGGFYGVAKEFALVKINKAVQNSKGKGNSIGYHGKLYVACDDHFKNGLSGSVPYIIMDGDAQMTGTDNANIKIPASTCNPGYNSTPDGGGEKDKVIEYAYAFEDMMVKAGDYDFNDVVLFVTTPYKKDGKLVIDATLKAAGATKKLKVLFKNGTTTTTLFENAHTALGVSEGTIVNTGATTGTPSTVTIEVGENFNLTNNGDFYISDGQREIHIPNFTTGFKAGDAPYALRIAQANWKWPKEQIQITEAYPDFANWANDATQAPDWYNNFNSGKVMGIE